ncbi:MAG: hypothetical protein R2729_00920 [Bryobacteraceae bacterium]
MADIENINDLSTEFTIDIANLSEEGQEQVHEAIEAVAAGGEEVDAEAVTDAIEAAQEADVHREAAVELQHEQAERAEAGDYEGAHEAAVEAEYHIQAVADLGGEDNTMDQWHEAQALGEADWHQDIADENAVTAESYLESGDADTAAIYSEAAVAETDVAASYADMGDHGGTYAPISSDTDTSAVE